VKAIPTPYYAEDLKWKKTYGNLSNFRLHQEGEFTQEREIVTELPSWAWEMRSGLQQALNQGKISPSVVRRRQPILLASSLTNGELRWIGLNTITDDEWLNQPYRPTSRLELELNPQTGQPARWIVRANPDDDDGV
jgi:hypothetical protein